MGNTYSNTKIIPSKKKFILGIIDVQYDFFKGGALAVTDAELIIGPINKLRYIYSDEFETFVSMDYHPKNHISFDITHGKKTYETEKLKVKMDDGITLDIEQVMWPGHCIVGTNGVNIHTDLILSKNDIYIRKGTKSNIESYSAFGDAYHGKYENTNLNKILKDKFITDIILTGVATDYCVYNTALDAVHYGYMVHLILSCTRGVNEETTKKALNHMIEKGVLIYTKLDDFYIYYDSIKNKK
jgi:nicotinamidase/pyrazinamidase